MNIQKSIDFEYILKLKNTFEIDHYFYIVLEYAENHMLFYFINGKNGIPEDLALRIFA